MQWTMHLNTGEFQSCSRKTLVAEKRLFLADIKSLGETAHQIFMLKICKCTLENVQLHSQKTRSDSLNIIFFSLPLSLEAESVTKFGASRCNATSWVGSLLFVNCVTLTLGPGWWEGGASVWWGDGVVECVDLILSWCVRLGVTITNTLWEPRHSAPPFAYLSSFTWSCKLAV